MMTPEFANRFDLAAARALARQVRRAVLEMTHRAQSSHVGGALSAVDLIAALYSGVLYVSPESVDSPRRDRFILSKGHACAALYATLAVRGFFPEQRLADFYSDGSPLMGHVTHNAVPGIEASTGSLGHGLSIGCGLALAAKHDQMRDRLPSRATSGAPSRVFVLLSDGECDEGSVWEAAMFAAHHALDNLVAIVDYNKIQSFGTVDEVLRLEPLADKWKAFGWSVSELDGHNLKHIGETLGAAPPAARKPTCVVAHTVKGKGVRFMENSLLWHYRAPDPAQLSQALAEVDASS